MTDIQQGWMFCADGYSWLQRSNLLDLLDPAGILVDVSLRPDDPALDPAWEEYRGADGWYQRVPARLVNELAAAHGGIVEVVSSRPDLAPPP